MGHYPAMLYQASVPVFRRYLVRLLALVDQAETFAVAQGSGPDALLQARLVPSMLPFAKQVEIAANFAVRATAPLAGRPLPDDVACEAGFEGLRVHLSRVQAFLDGVQPHAMAGAEMRLCASRAGDADVVLEGPRFLFEYALPNFFFHLSMAFAVLRQHGVAIGKTDFDGFHAYPR